MDLPRQLVAQFAAACSPLVLSGAGLSAESGLATFRGATGALWERYRPETLATPEAFQRDPALVWRWYRERRSAARRAIPNPAHQAIARLQTRRSGAAIVTQNVDGLLQRAGTNPVIEFHGNLFADVCMAGGNALVAADVDHDSLVPRCRRCGGPVRPGVVWFGEPIPGDIVDAAFAAADRADAVLVVGTSASVSPANSLAGVAQQNGAFVAEINTADTAISDSVDYVLRGKAGDILPSLVAALD